MSPELLGLLSILPLGIHFAVRSARLRPRMDAQGNRSYLRKALLFLGLSGMGSSLLGSGAGNFPMPFAWTMGLVLMAVAVLLGFLKRP